MCIMNKELEISPIWRTNDEANISLFSLIFDKMVNVKIYVAQPNRISERSLAVINDFLCLDQQSLEIIKGFLWEDCQFCCENISWGVDVPEGKTEAEANHDDLGIHNSNDALNKSTLKLTIDENEMLENNYGYLCFDNEWNSHLTTVVMKNGLIVGYGDSDICGASFE